MDTVCRMRRALQAILLACAASVLAGTASADDGWGWRRTTPRGELGEDGDDLLIAIPGGRAWGLQSAMRALPAAGTVLTAEVEVRDVAVREVFLRVAYYARTRAGARPRQISIADSEPAHPSETVLLSIAVDPPTEATAYRLRILGRLAEGHTRSDPYAIRASAPAPPSAMSPARPPHTRLLAYPR